MSSLRIQKYTDQVEHQGWLSGLQPDQPVPSNMERPSKWDEKRSDAGDERYGGGEFPIARLILLLMTQKFLRFPGGNNLEGNTIANRWKWNETIGPLKDRPGHATTWGYEQTNGLGLVEYMEWCEDLGLEPGKPTSICLAATFC